jgi:hypothetical protein
MKKSLFKKVRNTALILLLAAIGRASYMEYFPEKIKNKQDLLRIAGEEISKVRVENDKRMIYFMNGRTPWGTAASKKISENNYLIIFDNKRDRTTMRHELYHIFAGHADRSYTDKSWQGWDKFHDEFTANIYSYFGLRL